MTGRKSPGSCGAFDATWPETARREANAYATRRGHGIHVSKGMRGGENSAITPPQLTFLTGSGGGTKMSMAPLARYPEWGLRFAGS